MESKSLVMFMCEEDASGKTEIIYENILCADNEECLNGKCVKIPDDQYGPGNSPFGGLITQPWVS